MFVLSFKYSFLNGSYTFTSGKLTFGKLMMDMGESKRVQDYKYLTEIIEITFLLIVGVL